MCRTQKEFKKCDLFVSSDGGDLFAELRNDLRLGVQIFGEFDMVLLVESSEVLNLLLETVDLKTNRPHSGFSLC